MNKVKKRRKIDLTSILEILIALLIFTAIIGILTK